MHDLVEGALQEGRVDRGHRAHALEREAGREQHGLLLGDADVEIAVGHRLLQDREAGAGVHRGSDADDALVALALAHHRLAEDLGVLRRGDALRLGLGGRGTAVLDRVRLGGVPLLHALQAALLGGREALALDGGDVDDDGALGLEGGAQRLADGADVVAVDDAHVRPVELLPPQAGLPQRLDRLLDLRAEALEPRADAAPAAA